MCGIQQNLTKNLHDKGLSKKLDSPLIFLPQFVTFCPDLSHTILSKLRLSLWKMSFLLLPHPSQQPGKDDPVNGVGQVPAQETRQAPRDPQTQGIFGAEIPHKGAQQPHV